MKHVFTLIRVGLKDFICKDEANGVACFFEQNKFNETQRFSVESGAPVDANELARVASAMGDWLSANHYNEAMPINHRWRIGQEIKRRRLACGLSQQQLADQCDVRVETITRIESGKFAVTFDILERIAEAFNLIVGFIDHE